MTSFYLTITPHDSVIARDGRPFNFGIRMKSLDWPYPSVMAGSLRTCIGKMRTDAFDDVEKLIQISIAGPLALYNNQLLFPAPGDLLIKKEKTKKDDIERITEIHPIRPVKIGDEEGCDLPGGDSLLPAMIEVKEDSNEFKPDKIPPLWSCEQMIRWLMSPDGNSMDLAELNNGVYDLPVKDPRVHVSLDQETGISKDGMLFETIGLDFNLKGNKKSLQLAVRVENVENYKEVLTGLDTFHPFGGERKLSHWKQSNEQIGWRCPKGLMDKITKSSKIRMVLATPAIFSGGWLPGWLIDSDKKDIYEGTPPGLSKGQKEERPDYQEISQEKPDNLKLRLISACVDRWKPLSGWSLENGKIGPKKLRRVVPAGSVYFFEVLSGNPSILAKSCWLKPVSDEDQDRKDGFGLALWGIWDCEEKMN